MQFISRFFFLSLCMLLNNTRLSATQEEIKKLTTQLTAFKTNLQALNTTLKTLPAMSTNALDLFLKKYAPPKRLQDFIELHKDDEDYNFISLGPIKGLKGLPGFFNKGYGIYAVQRLFNAERLRKCIDEHHLTRLRVAHKYVYKLKLKDPYTDKVNDQICVFAETIGKGNIGKNIFTKKLTLEEVQQLATLIEETGISDLHTDNIIRDDDDKLVEIDTDSKAFSMGWGLKSQSLKMLLEGFGPNPIGMSNKGKGPLMTPEAQTWLEKRIADLEEAAKKSPDSDIINYCPRGKINPDAFSDPLFKQVEHLLAE